MRVVLCTIVIAAVWMVTTTCATNQLYSDCLAPGTQCPGQGPDDQEAVLFLVGDAGSKEFDDNPVLQHAKAAVAALDQRGVPATVVFLGDNVYEQGVRPGNPEDLRLLGAQVEVVAGTSAEGIFVPGNHDWGNTAKPEGLARLLNQEEALVAFSNDDLDVKLRPSAGCPGPVQENLVGSDGAVHAVLVMLDTPWWMMEPPTASGCGIRTKEGVIREMERIVSESSDVPLIVAAHHPMRTGGPHGGNSGPARWLAHRAGLLREDVNAGPYLDLIQRLSEVFATTSRPIIHAGGHDHSLQVIDETAEGSSVLYLVSGSGSKLTEAKAVPGSRFTAGLPGYMRLDFRSGGRIQLSVVAQCSEEAVAVDICQGGRAGQLQSVYRTRVR